MTKHRAMLVSTITFALVCTVVIGLMPGAVVHAYTIPATAPGLKYAADPTNNTGPVTLAVQLSGQPLVLTPGQNRLQALKDAQNALASTLSAKYGASILGHVYYALNAVIVRTDVSHLQQIAAEAGVTQVGILTDVQNEDPVTDDLVGATQVQQHDGLLGDGTVVAVLDTGTDFTHANLGGSGSVADYNTCYAQNTVAPSGICANFFGPSAPKVIGGFDFVGETWDGSTVTTLSPDPNPIAKAVTGSHGTHVADIIAGATGIAPHAKIVSVKVCSAISTACSNEATIEGLDFVAQWNLDPANASRKIDVVNMSLGASYGTEQDPVAAAAENLVHAGVVVAIAAGNSGNLPYVVSTGSIAPGAISVAQTAMPSDFLYPISVTINGTTTLIKNSVLQTFGPSLTTAISGPVQYGDGAGGNKNGCAAFTAGSLTGKIAFIDRGVCAISIKVSNAAAAGAVGVIIGLVAPGDPPQFSFGGGNPTVPSFVINQTSANLIRNATGSISAVIDPANRIPLVETVVGSSARGPSSSFQTIKPEIGAPGASLSAEAGTGNGQTVFGGTSGATPVIAGSALLVKEKYPTWGPLDIKDLLMNTAQTGIKAVDSDGNLYLASTDRIGAGEVRVNQAIVAQTLVSVPGTESAALSFGYTTVGNDVQHLKQTIQVTNMSDKDRLYKLSVSYRDPSEASSGAVQFIFSPVVFVRAHSSQKVDIQVLVFGSKLKTWTLNASQTGSSGLPLDAFTFDGYVKVDGGNSQNVDTIPWHLLPHKAADTQIQHTSTSHGTTTIQFTNNRGAVAGTVETFQLLGTRPSSGPQPGLGAGTALIDLKAFGVRDDGANLQFAVDTYDLRASPNYPAEFDVLIDTTGGQNPNFDLFNAECSLAFATDGRNCSFLLNLATNNLTLIGFTDATYDSSLLIQTVPLAALGVTSGQKISAIALASDNYYTGAVTSFLPASGNLAAYTVGQPRFTLQGNFSNGNTPATFTVNHFFSVNVKVGASTLSDATGLLFLYRDALNTHQESQTVTLP